jgi:proteasome lid subunit RPN8/RPN11
LENCYFLLGIKILWLRIGRVIYHSQGSVASVDFDWEKVYDSRWLLGFYHTHPGNSINYSDRDRRTMRAWVSCRWRDLICGIWNEKRTERNCYLFTKDKKVRLIKDFFYGKFYLAIEGKSK